MADLTYKLGDMYDGYSQTSTRELSLPDAEDVEKLADNDTNKQTVAVTDKHTSNASKGSILIAVGVITVIAFVLGAVRG